MANFVSKVKSILPSKRRFIQLYSALLYNAHLKGFITGNIYTGNGKFMCVPGLNCYSCPGAVGACPLGALQNAIASSGSRTPTYILGILLLMGLILGRTICGYLCPIGMLQELLYKLPTPKLKKSIFTRVLSYLKYVILFIFVLLIPFMYSLQSYPVPAFCKYICPAGTLEGAVGLLAHPVNADKYSMLGLLFTRKMMILIFTVSVCIFVFRAFCRFICPLGAIYSLFSRLALIGVKVDMTKCTDCGRCVSHCRMDIRSVGDHECIHCGECISICPTSAISFNAGKYTISNAQKALGETPVTSKNGKSLTHLVTIVAVVILCVVIFTVNRPEATASSVTAMSETASVELAESESGLSVGKDPGMKAPDFSVSLYGSEASFTLSDYLGQKVIINFWATWCTPCCNELPYFNDAYIQNQGNVMIIAIHSDLVTDDVEAYLEQYDYQFPFALDATGAVIKAFGGSTMLPLTVVVNEDGIITYNEVGSVTPEKISALLDAADSEQ